MNRFDSNFVYQVYLTYVMKLCTWNFHRDFLKFMEVVDIFFFSFSGGQSIISWKPIARFDSNIVYVKAKTTNSMQSCKSYREYDSERWANTNPWTMGSQKWDQCLGGVSIPCQLVTPAVSPNSQWGTWNNILCILWNCVPVIYWCRLRSIAAHRDHFVWHLSVCPSYRPSVCPYVLQSHFSM